MNYQLIIKFDTDNLFLDTDDIAEIEDDLINLLENEAEVDGHECGKKEANILLFTEKPEHNFKKIIKYLTKKIGNIYYQIAYRDVESDEFTILFPEGQTTFDAGI